MKYKAWNNLIRRVDNFELKKGITSFINPYSMLSLKDKHDLVKDIDFWHVDGISLVYELNRNSARKLKRFSFDDTSIAPEIFKFAGINKLNLAIIGTRKEHIEIAVEVIEKKYEIEIGYYRNGYFLDDKEMNQCIDQIIDKNIDIVICGMGTPYQEHFLVSLKRKGWGGYGFTCGGYLHQISTKEKYYPAIFDKWNVRWLYRMIDEPKLAKRYFFSYPIFFLEFLRFRRSSKTQF